MLTIYTPQITSRISFIMNLIFNEHLHIPYQLTESPVEFQRADVKISYAPQPLANEVFVWQHTLLNETEIKEQIIDCDVFEDEFIFFRCPTGQSFLRYDIFALSFYLLSRYEEYLPHQKDKYGRFPATESLAYKTGFLQKPLVDILILQFAKKLQETFPHLKYNLFPAEYIATYDIDNAYAYKYKEFGRTLGGLIKSSLHLNFKECMARLSVLFNKKQDPYDSYDYIQTLQEKYKLKNLYFILFAEKAKYDRGLNPKNKQFQQLIRQLSRQNETGIHPSFASASSKEKLQNEINNLSDVLQQKITLCRSHFLLLNFPETYQNYIANGIKEDFTLGYADQAGFRASTCKPFNFFDLSTNKETGLKLYPLAYMEGTLQGYMELSESEGFITIKQLMDVVKSVNGTFISLWHNETFGKKAWRSWQKVYEQSLDYFFTNF